MYWNQKGGKLSLWEWSQTSILPVRAKVIETPVPRSRKKRFRQMFPKGFCKIVKKSFFTKHLCTTAPEFSSSHECLCRSCDHVMQTGIFWTYLINKVKIPRICHISYKNYERINIMSTLTLNVVLPLALYCSSGYYLHTCLKRLVTFLSKSCVVN